MSTITRAHDVIRTDHEHATDLLRPEVHATEVLLRDLAPYEWSLRTDCVRWEVRDVVAHMLANAESVLDADLMEERIREGERRYPELYRLDAFNEAGVQAWADQHPASLVNEFTRLWRRAIDVLREMPESARSQTFDAGYPGVPPIELGYVWDVVFTRDMWMHRIDLCRATQRDFAAGAHTRGVVEQVLRDLDDVWSGPAVVLDLTGAVAGDWQFGQGEAAATVRVDTVEFLRALSGRTEPQPEFTVLRGDPAVLDTLRAARVPF